MTKKITRPSSTVIGYLRVCGWPGPGGSEHLADLALSPGERHPKNWAVLGPGASAVVKVGVRDIRIAQPLSYPQKIATSLIFGAMANLGLGD